MPLKINEHKVKLSGTANMPEGLENGNSYDIVISDAEVCKSSDIPNHDGTKDVVHSLRISELSTVSIVSQKGVIIAKKQGSQARVLRKVLEDRASELDLDKEEYYQKTMAEIIRRERDSEG